MKNEKLEGQLRELMDVTDDKFRKVVSMIELYEKRHIVEKEEEKVEQERKFDEDVYGMIETNRALEAKLQGKDDEIKFMPTTTSYITFIFTCDCVSENVTISTLLMSS